MHLDVVVNDFVKVCLVVIGIPFKHALSRLLLFGLLLVIMMRFRPEGLVANKRRQLELHDDDQDRAAQTDRSPQTKEALQ